MSTMDYKGFIAKIDYDSESESFQGKTINADKVISFYGYSADELKENFHAAVDLYLEHCEKNGLEPMKAFTGQLRLRLDPDIHAKVSEAAAAQDQSLNMFIAEAVKEKAAEVLQE